MKFANTKVVDAWGLVYTFSTLIFYSGPVYIKISLNVSYMSYFGINCKIRDINVVKGR